MHRRDFIIGVSSSVVLPLVPAAYEVMNNASDLQPLSVDDVSEDQRRRFRIYLHVSRHFQSCHSPF